LAVVSLVQLSTTNYADKRISCCLIQYNELIARINELAVVSLVLVQRNFVLARQWRG